MKTSLVSIWVVCVSVMVAVTLSSVPPGLSADDVENESSLSKRDRWMAAKLSMSQQILEHLTSGDFDQLENSARRIQIVNFLEQWQRDTEFARRSEYQGQVNAFEFATKELVRNAADENVDGALNAYVAMTQSCVRCHVLIRDAE